MLKLGLAIQDLGADSCNGKIILAKEKLATTHMTLLQGPKDPVLPTLAIGPMYIVHTQLLIYLIPF